MVLNHCSTVPLALGEIMILRIRKCHTELFVIICDV